MCEDFITSFEVKLLLTGIIGYVVACIIELACDSFWSDVLAVATAIISLVTIVSALLIGIWG